MQSNHCSPSSCKLDTFWETKAFFILAWMAWSVVRSSQSLSACKWRQWTIKTENDELQQSAQSQGIGNQAANSRWWPPGWQLGGCSTCLHVCCWWGGQDGGKVRVENRSQLIKEVHLYFFLSKLWVHCTGQLLLIFHYEWNKDRIFSVTSRSFTDCLFYRKAYWYCQCLVWINTENITHDHTNSIKWTGGRASKNSECFVCFFLTNFATTSFASLTKIPLHSLKIHLPSERVLTVWGNLADFIIAVKVMISVRSSLLQPVQSPFIRRIRCFCRKIWINAWLT